MKKGKHQTIEQKKNSNKETIDSVSKQSIVIFSFPINDPNESFFFPVHFSDYVIMSSNKKPN